MASGLTGLMGITYQ